MHGLSYCFETCLLQTSDDKQLINSLRQLTGFLKNLCRKIRRAENLTTCFQTLTNMGLRKEFQAVGNRTLYVCLATRVDTINVKQVTIFNDFVDSQ